MILRDSGARLGIESEIAADAVLSAVVLPPDQLDAALLTLSWQNWCGDAPGPLELEIVLPAAAGTVVAPFDGPPDYDYLPTCQSSIQPSIVEVQGAYSLT